MNQSSPLNHTVERLLAALPPSDRLDFFALLGALDTIRFTGQVSFDFLNGRPKHVYLGAPVRLAIFEGDPPKGLDTEGKNRAG